MAYTSIFPNELRNEVKLTMNGIHYVLTFPSAWDRWNFRGMFNNGSFLGNESIEFDGRTHTKAIVMAMAKTYIGRYNLKKVIDKTK